MEKCIYQKYKWIYYKVVINYNTIHVIQYIWIGFIAKIVINHSTTYTPSSKNVVPTSTVNSKIFQRQKCTQLKQKFTQKSKIYHSLTQYGVIVYKNLPKMEKNWLSY